MRKDKFPISLLKSSSSAFTLVELIIVIIIVGILAAMGISQYSKTVEKSRGAEARQILGDIRKLAIAYRLENGTITGMQESDLNVGSGQIPNSCVSSHYFYYFPRVGTAVDPSLVIDAIRCTSGGKSPQGPDGMLRMVLNCSDGSVSFTNGSGGSPIW
ncbi:prepilin-type N-terminal cleavage/methylation domain-containing protein [bacterium]|nr:MAG: prepilin-type N-terminal cleavage/methylation domain-containing protein [bacterium]